MSNGAAYLGEYIPCPRLLRESLAERCSERWIESCRQDLLGPIVAVNERPLKRLLSEYVRYHREDRTHLGLEKGTPDGFVPWLRVGSFPRSDSAGCPIVTIERPSPDWPRVLYIYMCALPALGFLPSGVFVLYRGNIHIQAYSTKNRPAFGPG